MKPAPTVIDGDLDWVQDSRVPLYWRCEAPEQVVGWQPRTVLQVEAKRSCEAMHAYVEVRDPSPGLEVECLIVRQEPAHGVRLLSVEHIEGNLSFVRCRAGNGGGDLGRSLIHQVIRFPHDFWTWIGRDVELMLCPGQAVGIVVRANRPCRVLAQIGGR